MLIQEKQAGSQEESKRPLEQKRPSSKVDCEKIRQLLRLIDADSEASSQRLGPSRFLDDPSACRSPCTFTCPPATKTPTDEVRALPAEDSGAFPKDLSLSSIQEAVQPVAVPRSGVVSITALIDRGGLRRQKTWPSGSRSFPSSITIIGHSRTGTWR